MTAGSAEGRAPVLVLGLGNPLLADDGVGLELLRRLGAEPFWPPDAVELLDGGTQGIALLPHLEGRRALLVLDAVALGASPGTVHVLPGARVPAAPRGLGAHEGNAAELLAAATLTGDLPETVAVVGVEPAVIRTHEGLSPAVEAALPGALDAARGSLRRMLAATP